MPRRPPLVLLHGLWDTPRVFRRLEAELLGRCPELELFAPHLPHRLGAVPLRRLAATLAPLITERFGPAEPLDLLGFSRGGLVGRLWLQDLGGAERCRRFLCLGSPQRGTLAAQAVPRALLAGIADMKLGSPLLRHLDGGTARLRGLDCSSFYCPTELTVFPGWRAVLPVGERRALPVCTHRQLIGHPRALAAVADWVLERLLAP
ncbi:MAG: esterase/lipase family protein [Vulcanococcus sp.]